MEFSNDYLQQLILPNLHSCSSTNIFGHEISPFQPQNFPHEMGNFFLPQPLDQDLNSTSTPPPNNQEVEALSLDKKHRHTKIATAQGVRDRRVRLSMGIAREFFDLQDMLGFDKPSKTLAWLFAKSRGAIQELALEKKSLGSFSFGTDEDASIGCSTSTGALVRRRICSEFASEQSCCKSGRASGGISQAQCNKSLVARENRAKARARARERTREKLSTKAQFDHHGTSYGSSNSLLDSIGINVIKSDELSRLIGIYSQTHPNGDLHNPLAESIPSLSGWNIFTFTNW